MPQQIQPEILDEAVDHSGGYVTVIFNNETNSFDEVVEALMNATRCCFEEAQIETWEAHTYGQANVHFGSERICSEVASQVSRIGVKTEVRPEWE